MCTGWSSSSSALEGVDQMKMRNTPFIIVSLFYNQNNSVFHHKSIAWSHHSQMVLRGFREVTRSWNSKKRHSGQALCFPHHMRIHQEDTRIPKNDLFKYSLSYSCTMNFGLSQFCWSLGKCKSISHPGPERDKASSWEAKEDKDVHCKELGWKSKQDKRKTCIDLSVARFHRCTILYGWFAVGVQLKVSIKSKLLSPPCLHTSGNSLCDLMQTWLIKSLINCLRSPVLHSTPPPGAHGHWNLTLHTCSWSFWQPTPTRSCLVPSWGGSLVWLQECIKWVKSPLSPL